MKAEKASQELDLFERYLWNRIFLGESMAA